MIFWLQSLCFSHTSLYRTSSDSLPRLSTQRFAKTAKNDQLQLHRRDNDNDDDDCIFKQWLGWNVQIISTTFKNKCGILFLPQIIQFPENGYRSISFWWPQNIIIILYYIILYYMCHRLSLTWNNYLANQDSGGKKVTEWIEREGDLFTNEIDFGCQLSIIHLLDNCFALQPLHCTYQK